MTKVYRVTWATNLLIVVTVFFIVFSPVALAHTLSPKVVSFLSQDATTTHTVDLSTATTTDPRNFSRTLSTFPEWYIVYSAEEYSDLMSRGGRPSQFPYFAAITQYWQSLRDIKSSLNGTEIDAETLSVLQVIGISFTIEYGIIGLYEKTIGRVFEWLHLNHKTNEDYTTDRIARAYSDSLLQTPWYDFSYSTAVTQLWQSWNWSSLSLRGLERRIIFTLSYHLKGAYAALLGKIAEANFGYVGSTTSITTVNIDQTTLSAIPSISSLEATSDGVTALAPRYRAFTTVAQTISENGGNFIEIQGNTQILITFVTPHNHTCGLPGKTILKLPILTNTEDARFGQLIEVTELHYALRQLKSCGITLEHIYDY